ncbi:hypothetical protein BP5796_08890 [Coleophoma crateriformis]|uniref:Uncharacterized protein n=1 Tax=Coleophoma crateriformis TaxID=565419 RepID=A0A3D8R2G1_9HELO|nr:hypothetical protein BP5796_08890 [Coleophoma crateriformis]
MAFITNRETDHERGNPPIKSNYPDPEDCAPGITPPNTTWHQQFGIAQETRQPQPNKPVLTPTSTPTRHFNQASHKRRSGGRYGNVQQRMSRAASASSPLSRDPRTLKKARLDSNPLNSIRAPPSTQASHRPPAIPRAAAIARISAVQRSNTNTHQGWVPVNLPPRNAPRAINQPIFDTPPPPRDNYVAFLTDERTQRLIEEELAFLRTTDLLDPTYHYYQTYKSTYWAESYFSIILDAMTCFYIHRYLYGVASSPTMRHEVRPRFPRRWKSLRDAGVVDFLCQDWYSWFEQKPPPGAQLYAWHIFGERCRQARRG